MRWPLLAPVANVRYLRWTYQSLVHDVLNMKLNRITIETPVDENNPARGTTKKAYDLTSSDFFWAKNAGLPFPQVAEDIDTGEA